MSSHHHRSPVFMEQPVSPPHLLSPELGPNSAVVPSTNPESTEHTSDEPSSQSATSNEQAGDGPAPGGHSSTPAPPAELPADSVAPVTETAPDNSPGNDVITEMPTSDQGSAVATTTSMDDAAGEGAASGHNPDEVRQGTDTMVNGTEAPPAEPTTEDAISTEAPADRPASPSADGEPSSATPQEPAVTSEPAAEPEAVDNTPAWVLFEEDTSVPDDEEMKEVLEAEMDRLDAADIRAMENHLYTDLDDPEQRPCKKLRLNWVIRGIRGTREKPNMAKVLNSPAVCIDGLYWSIKFYPRGDNCTSLSAFVRCSRMPPKQLEEMPEQEFAFFEGPPDADFGDKELEPIVRVSAPNTIKVRPTVKPAKKNAAVTEEVKKTDENRDASSERPWTPVPDDDDPGDTTDDSSKSDLKDWRVSAQLGMAIYNPAETRTSHSQSDGHQYSKHCDDWGWVNFTGPWDEIHKRKRGQRTPLLQNDALGIDAYVRIYDDPTAALWWHDSKDEPQWPSKQLAGFYPMGTPALYHAPAVAGITAWAVMAPFRTIIQAHDGYRWRQDSSIMPTPLVCQTQLVLQLMRNLVGDCYVSVYKVIEELMEADEPWEDVKSFWEVYRRGLELELKADDQAMKALSDMFDANGRRFEMPALPVPGASDVGSGLAKHFEDSGFKGSLPNFMPVMLNRQHFDKDKREWKLHQDRIRLTDELELSQWCTDEDAEYVLYGFVVHVGSRNSGKFYSILRPGGVGTKWLAFEDGNGNKVFSYTKKKIQEFEGLEGDDLKNFTGEREKAYMAMYIRKSRWNEYLPAELEAYTLPTWLRPWIDGPVEISDDLFKLEMQRKQEAVEKQAKEGVQVEIYLDESVRGRENMLELHDIRCSPEARACRQTIVVAVDKTFIDLRSKIAEALEATDASRVTLWELGYRNVGRFSRAELETISWRRKIRKHIQPGEIFQLWLTVLPHDGRKDSYRDLLPRIAEMGLEKLSPKPEPVPEAVETTQADEGAEVVPDNAEATPPADRSADEARHQPADASSSHTEDSNTTGVATPATGDTADSAQDREQASVAAAVAGDVERGAASVQDTTTSEASQTASAVSSGTEEPPGSTSTTPVAVEINERASTTPVPDRPLEHNHLVEAAQAPEVASGTTQASDTDVIEVHGPMPDEEISAEDAAAIAALLAADAAENAAEIAAQVEGAEEMPDTNGVDQIDTRPYSPALNAEPAQERAATPPPLHVYGFLHVFDAEGQKFIAQAPFDPVIEHEVGPSVCKALGYAEDKEIRIWRRDGPSGTSPVTASSTFINGNFQDGFLLIVGDILSESKIEALKQAGKFWQPAQLIKHLLMKRRGHPFLSITSKDPVESAEFGIDYFRGPIVNGRPHGEDCLLITASGHTYEGPLIAGLKSGDKGKMTYQNGDVYTGQWLNDERHGQGEHLEARTGNRYVGGFENGKRWGEGTTFWKVADEQAAMCQICYGEEIDALFFDCGHVCACIECAERQRDNGCPICRKPVRQVVKMYRA